MSGLPVRIISSSSARAASACSLENKKSHFGEGITADDMNKLRGGLDGARENQTTWKSSGPPRHNPRQFCLDVASARPPTDWHSDHKDEPRRHRSPASARSV